MLYSLLMPSEPCKSVRVFGPILQDPGTSPASVPWSTNDAPPERHGRANLRPRAHDECGASRHQHQPLSGAMPVSKSLYATARLGASNYQAYDASEIYCPDEVVRRDRNAGEHAALRTVGHRKRMQCASEESYANH